MDGKTAVDYTKYKLKPDNEIKKLLVGFLSCGLLICEKCYKEFNTDSELEYDCLSSIFEEAGIKVSVCISIPFLCNNHLTDKILADIDSTEPMAVVACGIGIQFVAGKLNGRKVFALADTISESGNATSIVGYHGVALGGEKCAACGQCYLEITGGICPVVNCAKSLVNGPCGGADKNGKCEVNHEKNCVWIEIFERLKQQKGQILNTIEIRNYNIFLPDRQKEISCLNQTRRNEGFYGGIYPEDKKDTSIIPIKNFPPPERLYIFLSQHAGLLARAVVKVGEKVRCGQKIAERAGFISACVHSAISGKVLSFEEKIHPVSGQLSPAVIIENDGLDMWDSCLHPLERWESLANDEILRFLRVCGLVGLGGAMFPTDVKLCPPKKVDALLINGCECEPYLTGDNRLMIEHAKEILKGIKVAQKLLCVKNIFFCIEDNKKDAIESISALKEIYPGLNIIKLKAKYPQGAERMLVKKVLQRDVPEEGLPFDVGAAVFNVSTMYAIYQAVYKGIPLIERVITVAGEGAALKGNFIVKVGTPFTDIVDRCLVFGDDVKNYDMKMGGPMMGILQKDLNSAVIKGTTAILLLQKYPIESSESRDCIKCGRCADVCPMELYPHYYSYYGKKNLQHKMIEHGVKRCIECGCCQYICPSKIDIMNYIKKAKRYAYNKD